MDWFKFHEASQLSSTGFWGNSFNKKYYSGFQNAFHQFEIYNYWCRDIPFYEKVVDTVLFLQDREGHFAPTPGGGGCLDYDAADILINLGYKKEYRKQAVRLSLVRLLEAIMKSQNTDGGFCESRKRPSSLRSIFQVHNLKFVFSGLNPYLWYFRLKKTVSNSRKSRDKINTHWTRIGRGWEQSDMWNTWFRCLTIAVIDEVLNISNPKFEWNFQKCVGLGFFRKPEIFGKSSPLV